MKLTLKQLIATTESYGIQLDPTDILNSLTPGRQRNTWTLRLFNTFEQIASVPAIYSDTTTAPLVNNIDYVRSSSNRPLLFIKKHIIGTNIQKPYSNVKYHHRDIKGSWDNRKTDLIIDSSELREYIAKVDSSELREYIAKVDSSELREAEGI